MLKQKLELIYYKDDVVYREVFPLPDVKEEDFTSFNPASPRFKWESDNKEGNKMPNAIIVFPIVWDEEKIKAQELLIISKKPTD